MHGLSLPGNILTSAASDALTNLASRVSSTAKSFASDLQQATGSGSSTASASSPAGSSFGSALNQLGSDLSSGNLSAAQSDFNSLQQALAFRKATFGAQGLSGDGASDSSLTSFGAYSTLQQQAAYSKIYVLRTDDAPLSPDEERDVFVINEEIAAEFVFNDRYVIKHIDLITDTNDVQKFGKLLHNLRMKAEEFQKRR